MKVASAGLEDFVDWMGVISSVPVEEEEMSKLAAGFAALMRNFCRPDYIYKFMALLPKDYYLIIGNGAKTLLSSIGLDQIYQVISIADQRLTIVLGNGLNELWVSNSHTSWY